MAIIRWVFSLAVLAMWCALIGTGLFVAMHEPSEETPEAQAIVVLAGNAGVDGKLNGETAERLAHGLSLFEDGAAPLFVVTGGGEPPVARDMATEALAAGVPETALLVEASSHSTLQNALFTADFERLDKSAPIILVTQRYHIPRASASFRWAGFENVINSAADAGQDFSIDQRLLWEAVKWPWNVLRAAAASAAMMGNVPREDYLKYLE